jgi:hypothetical protein
VSSFVDAGATGDIAVAVLRRQGTIAVPVFVWDGAAWIDFATMTGPQFSAWVDARCAGAAQIGGKVPNVTISRTNDW